MVTMFSLNSILGIYIILALVLVIMVQKQNSASGHARNVNMIPGSCERFWQKAAE